MSLFLLGCGSSQLDDGAPRDFPPVTSDVAPIEVVAAAEAGLPQFIGLLGDRWADYGFADSHEPGVAELGASYPIYQLRNPGTPAQAITAAGEWYFKVMAGGFCRCILTVAAMNGQWQAVGMGAARLAASVQAAEASHPSLASGGRGIVKVYGYASYPYEILGVNLTQARPSFLLLPPDATELVKRLPRYGAWTDADPVPVLSYEELSEILVSLGR